MSSSATSVSVQMPQMGISVSEGTILEWRKAVGDPVAADETIADVTTDKVDVEIPAPAAGVLARILVEPGDTVPVGEVIAEIDAGSSSSNGSGANGSGMTTEQRARRIARASSRRWCAAWPPSTASISHESRDTASAGGSASRTSWRSPRSQTAREQALTAAPHRVAVRPREPGGRREEMTPMRKSIAEHMLRSRQTAAHCTTIVEADFSAVAARRAELKEAYERRGVPLTYLAFVARAVVEALEEFPIVNASVDGDEIVFHDDVNLGIAVALDEGLIVPVIPQAQRLVLEGMAAAIDELARRARERSLTPDDVQGGTFTITNPGQFGAVLATPIINQPQVAILDLEAIVKRAVVVDDAIAIRPMAYLPMSWDHRAMDGAAAARFLGAVKDKLENGAVR